MIQSGQIINNRDAGVFDIPPPQKKENNLSFPPIHLTPPTCIYLVNIKKYFSKLKIFTPAQTEDEGGDI